jgi:hypothetical protein
MSDLTPEKLDEIEGWAKAGILLSRKYSLRLIAAARAYQWMPIETAPKDGTDILVAYGSSVGWMNIVKWHEKKSGWRWVCSYTHKRLWNNPTHWLPLPQPPQQREDDETEKLSSPKGQTARCNEGADDSGEGGQDQEGPQRQSQNQVTPAPSSTVELCPHGLAEALKQLGLVSARLGEVQSTIEAKDAEIRTLRNYGVTAQEQLEAKDAEKAQGIAMMNELASKCNEAQAEIERLLSLANAQAREIAARYSQVAEIERLREALRQYAELEPPYSGTPYLARAALNRSDGE